jgi:CheY-like chemotaxis protein
MPRERLSPHHVGTTSIMLDSPIFEALTSPEHDNVVFPEPTLSVLENYGVAPDDLRKLDDMFVPEDEDDALEYAIDRFKEDDHIYYEWKDTNQPIMMYIWPVDYVSNPQVLANLLEEEGLAVVYVDGTAKLDLAEGGTADIEHKGFMFTGGGMNLADHLAMAYILADYIPPDAILGDAFRNTHRDEWKSRFVKAMEQMADYYTGQSERLLEHVARFKESAAPAF